MKIQLIPDSTSCLPMPVRVGLLMLAAALASANASTYTAPIEYRVDLTQIVDRDAVVWDAENARWHDFRDVQVSADGSTVLFNVTCEFCAPGTGHANRPFVVAPDGTGLRDISDLYPPDIVSAWWSWGSLRINDDATELFLRIQRDIGYYGEHHWYAYDLLSGQRSDAIQNPFRYLEGSIDAAGSKFFFSPYNAGWSESLQRQRKGLFYAERGGAEQQIVDVIELACTIDDCSARWDATNVMSFVGNSAEGEHVFFAWSDAFAGENSWEIYHINLGGNLFPLTGSRHYAVDRNLIRRGFCTEDGSLALYKYRHRQGDPLTLSVVDVITGAEQPLTSTTDLNGFSSFITRSGRFVYVSGDSGSAHAWHYRTLFDLAQGTQRDTDSYHLPRDIAAVSNITADDSTYYLTREASLYRVDLAPSSAGKAPRISRVAFSAPALLDADGVRIGMTATVTDDAGPAGIDWVIILPIVEGRESPAWGMARAPLAYVGGNLGGDMGFEYLFDDGSRGDAVAGDGIYSFNGIETRKGGRDPGWNSWYLNETLPALVGIRIVAKDVDDNYSITDSRLLITDDPLDLQRRTAQEAYIAYYGRPADPAGLDYWSNRLGDEGGDLRAIIAAFGNSPEYDSRFGGLPSATLIGNLYRYLFNRDPEPAGLAYWLDQYESGAKSLQVIALDVLYGAQGDDVLTVGNKVILADYFTARVREGCTYDNDAIPAALGFLASVDATAGSVTSVMADVDHYCGR